MMRVALGYVLVLAWSGFWASYALGSALHDGVGWQGMLIYAAQPVFICFGLFGIACWRRHTGAILLLAAGFLLAGLHPIFYAEFDRGTKLFVMATLAGPPFVGGLLLETGPR